MKTTTSLTKEVVNYHLPKFHALIARWMMFCCEPIVALLLYQVVLQFLIKECMLFLYVSVEGFDKAGYRTGAMLSTAKPEGMFKTDEDS